MRYLNNATLKDSMANYEGDINDLVDYNDRSISTLDNQLEDVSKLEDMHDFWNSHKNFVGYTPDLQFHLTMKDKNFIPLFAKVNSNGNVSSSLNVDILQPENNPPLLSNDFNADNKVIIAYHYLYATTEMNNGVAVLIVIITFFWPFSSNRLKTARFLFSVFSRKIETILS